MVDLTSSEGAFTPAFDAGTFEYAQSVTNAVGSITFTPTASGSATIEVDGYGVGSGDAVDVDLAVGDNVVTFAVIGATGTRTYTVTVTRAADVTTTTTTTTEPPATTEPTTTTTEPPTTTTEPPAPPAYQPITPTRLTDTREVRRPARAGRVLVVQVGGKAGVPADAASALLNIAVVGADGRGFITVYPCGSDRPETSNLNIEDSGAVSNAVLAKLGEGGTVCVYSSVDADVVVDISGYADDGGAQYQPVRPHRIADTRSGGRPVRAGTVVRVPVRANATVPADTTSVVLNVAVTGAGRPGYATVFPCDTERPGTSNVNFDRGRAISNAVVSALGADGSVCVYVSTDAHVIVDVNGAYAPSGSAKQRAVDPHRLLDTRVARRPVRGGDEVTIAVTGRAGVPAGATAVMLNLTVVDPHGPGYATVYPCGTTRPLASNVNVDGRSAVPNAVFASVGDSGSVCVYVSATAHVVVDVTGYAAPAD